MCARHSKVVYDKLRGFSSLLVMQQRLPCPDQYIIHCGPHTALLHMVIRVVVLLCPHQQSLGFNVAFRGIVQQ